MDNNHIESTKVQNVNRRKLLKILSATGGAMAASTLLSNKWTSPIIETGFIPVHAQASTIATGTCNSLVQAGGNTPETHTFDMGQSTGTFDFYYETYSVRDRIIVSQEGTILFDTGCVGASDTVPLTLNGSSNIITVEVQPNCDGTSGTAWQFRVDCVL